MNDSSIITPEQLKIAAWLVGTVIFFLVFRTPLSRLIDRIRGVRLKDKDGREIDISTTELRDSAQQLLDEADDIIARLQPADRTLLRRIVSAGRAVKISAVIPDFQRGSPEHESLRRLRDAQLIRPVEGGQFASDKHLDLKPFGRVLLRVRKTQLLNDAASQITD